MHIMHVFVLSTLLGIFVSTKAAKPRSINVALDTVFEFDKPSDVDFIDQVQLILNKVKNIIKDNPEINETKRYTFTNFLEDAVDVLQSFNDEDLREIIQIVDNEIRKHLQSNALEENLRRLLSNELNRFKIQPIKKIRKDLDNFKKVKNGKNNINGNYFLDFINTLYKRDSEQKLARFIRKLKIFRRNNFSRKNEKFQQVVRRSLSSAIFEHFLNMSENTKRKFLTRIQDYLHDAVSKVETGKIYSRFQNKHKPKIVLQYDVEAEIFNEVKNRSNMSIRTRTSDNKKRYPSQIEYQGKSQAIEEIREQTDSSTEFIKKESIGTSREISGVPNNDKIHLKQNIKLRHPKKGQNKEAQKRYQIVKIKQTKFSKELEERSSGEIKKKGNDKRNTKYANFKISRNHKIKTQNPNFKMNYSRMFTLHPEDFENANMKAVFQQTEPAKKGNIKIAKNNETLNDVSLSSISQSAEINVNFKNNKMLFSVNSDSVEDTLVGVKASRQNPMENKPADKQQDEQKITQINSQDATEKRHETSLKRFKTVNRSRRLFRGHNNVDKYRNKAPKQVEYVQNNLNTNNIDYFKKNVDRVQWNFMKSPKIKHFRRKDFILAKELIANNLNAKKKIDQKLDRISVRNESNNTLKYGNYTIEEDKPHKRFNIIDFNENYVTTTQNKHDSSLIKLTTNNNFIDDHYIARTKLVKRLKPIETTNHEQQNDEVNIVENIVETSIKTMEFTTKREPFYRRAEKPYDIDELRKSSYNNVANELNLTKISHDLDSKTNKQRMITDRTVSHVMVLSKAAKLKNREEEKMDINNDKILNTTLKTGIKNILKKVVENKLTVRQNTPQSYTTKPATVQFTQNIDDNYSNNLRRAEIRNVKQKQNEIRIHLKNSSDIFERDSEINEAKKRAFGRPYNVKAVTKINKFKKIKPVEYTKQLNYNKILKYTGLFNKTNSPNKNIDSYKKDINTRDSRKLVVLNESEKTTAKMNEIKVSKKKETKSNFKINDSSILLNTTQKTKTSTTVNTNINSELKKNKMKSNVDKVNDSRRILSTPKATTLINLDANLDDLAFEVTMADLNTNTTEVDSNTFDIKKYLKNRDLPVEDDPKNEIAKKMKQDLENIFTLNASSATTSATYTDIFEALENAFDL